jgi:AcrR family transcriptional regulator
VTGAVKTPQRTRRADKAQETHQRIVRAATRLFTEHGYVPTTIEAIAEAADVAVETVYARFGNKTNLMIAVKDAAVTEDGQVPLQQRPELAAIAAQTSQPRQLRAAAALSRAMLERIAPVYAVLRDAAAADPALRQALTAEIRRRQDFQRALVDLVHACGPLRDGLSPGQAADTYSALASPDLYLLLTTHHGWTADRYQAWLVHSLQLLILPEPYDDSGDRQLASPAAGSSHHPPWMRRTRPPGRIVRVTIYRKRILGVPKWQSIRSWPLSGSTTMSAPLMPTISLSRICTPKRA